MLKKEKKQQRQRRNGRPLLFEPLEYRALLSGTTEWTPTTVNYPINDHDAAVASTPAKRSITHVRANTVADATGTSTMGQFTDTLDAKASVVGTTTVVGQIDNYSLKTQADVQKVDAVGQITGGLGATKDVATQSYAFADYYLQARGVGSITLSVNATAHYEHVWAATTASETTTNQNEVVGQINITVVGTFTVNVQARAANEEMEFVFSDASGYDHARTKSALASISVSIITSGTYTITATGSATCHTEWIYDYGGGAMSGGQNESKGDLNVRSRGTRGGVSFATNADRTFVSGFADDFGQAKETRYASAGSFSVDSRTASSSGQIVTSAQYDTQDDTNSAIVPPRGPGRVGTSSIVRTAPPSHDELALHKIWSDALFLEGLLFTRSL